MERIQPVVTLLALLILSSFTGIQGTDGLVSETKIYSTCTCENDAASATKVALTLHLDHTFDYQNPTAVDLSGTWRMDGKKIVLIANSGKTDFHNIWKFEIGNQCIKSRKGLDFIRLCDVESLD